VIVRLLMKNTLHRDDSFFRRFALITLPIIIQNGITNFVSLLDNIMIGQVGTEQMSGVSIVNSLLFVFNLCIFGGTAGSGIYIAQFFGSENHDGIRHTFRFKTLLCLLLGILGIGIFSFAGDPLISLYLQGEGDPASALRTLEYGRSYLLIMLVGLVPFAITNSYSSTLRECGQSFVPMLAGVVAVLVNLVFNYILIFGHFGAPAMGVAGAAIATVISRYVELAIVAIWTHKNYQKFPFIKGVFRSLHIPAGLFKTLAIKSAPLLINEALWSGSEAFMSQIYSTKGLDVVPAVNITSTIYNLSSVVVLAMACSVGIVMGQMMGAGASKDEIWSANKKLMGMCAIASVIFGGVLASVSGVFPRLYNTTEAVRNLSTHMIIICAVFLPAIGYINPVYFSIRAGGKALTTFLFDSGFNWGIIIPMALILSNLIALPILPIYAACRGAAVLKCFVGYLFLRRKDWIQNLAIK